MIQLGRGHWRTYRRQGVKKWWYIVSSCSQSIAYDASKDAMENEEISVIIWCWPDPQTKVTRLRIVNVATGEEMNLKDGSFLVHISIDAKASVTRCYIRHIASGREASVQGGPKLPAFVKDCLLNSGESKSTGTS